MSNYYTSDGTGDPVRQPGTLIQSSDSIKSAYPDIDDIPVYCRNCSNHPRNGGSGICHCILGMLRITC